MIQIPLWAPVEPQDYESYTREYYKVVDRKANTTSEIIEEKFLPVFNEFLNLVYDEEATGPVLDQVFYGIWEYFQSYDYRETLQHELVWQAFKKKAL